MAAHIKRIAVRDYFVVNVTDDSCLVFPLYEIISGAVMLFFIIAICIDIDIMYY